ncbi:DUF4394 domain-containing protein [Aquabacterium parvum]|jgi:hypothetical protein|uniref:DUF4394 domain-containing protein n=1 Tax=Aquabacterium parvum TaxID=70584 RepID=UPI000718D9D9|nr:DUF4394 domain-containing protein [Aquabacterium parvum]MBU0915187.1 DUF4394 domain-containing protein [Gammaproteobacteria bacterium]
MFKPSILALAAIFSVSVAQAEALYGLTTDNRLITFDTAAPSMGSAVGLSGLAASEKLLGLDTRPTNGQLYTLSNLGNVYTLDASTGAATFVTALKAPINGSLLGFDFNPNADVSGAASLRVLTAAGDNYAVNVNPGANLGAVAKQTNVSSASGSLKLTGAAYSNNDTNPATPTVLFAIDTISSSLFSTSAPAGGVYTRVGSLGASSLNVFGFDISGSGVAYAGLTGDDSYSSLYTINLQTGAASLIGAFGIQGNTALPTIVGLAVAPAVPEPSTVGLMLAGLGAVGFGLRRGRARAQA